MSSSSLNAPDARRLRGSRLGLLPGRRAGLLFALLFAALSPNARAQQAAPSVVVSDTVMEVRLSDGSVLYGRIVAIDGDRVTIVTESGARTEISRTQLTSVRATTSRLVNGERWNDDPNATRLFFGPTARAVGQGSGYFAVYELLMPFLTYGLNDQISISGGTPVIPGLIGEIVYVAPKITVVSRPGVDLAAGVLAFFVPDEEESLGLLYGVGTFGTRDNAFTVGVGAPFFTGGDQTFADRVVLMLGLEGRMTRHTKFITESYFVPGEGGGLIAPGIRFFGERLSADAGLGFAVGDGSGCCLPVVNFVYSFGRPR